MKAELGDTVIVIYDGITENGDVFDSSESSGPLEFQIGSGSVLPSFEENIIGMVESEKKSFTLPPEQAYGLNDPELVHTVDKNVLPHDAELKVGMVLGLNVEKEGATHKVPAMVTAIEGEQVIIDFNHPLAGKKLTYTVTMQAIKKGKAE